MSNKLKGCFMHQSDLWKTPKQIYEFYISNGYFDPCPSNPTFDGLKIKWHRYNFVNPPYSQISKWIDKALEETKKRNRISTFLVPARTDTKWFHKLLKAKMDREIDLTISYIKGRLHFNDGKTGAPFPSIYITIMPKYYYETNQLKEYGFYPYYEDNDVNIIDIAKQFLNRR